MKGYVIVCPGIFRYAGTGNSGLREPLASGFLSATGEYIEDTNRTEFVEQHLFRSRKAARASLAESKKRYPNVDYFILKVESVR